MANLGNIGVRSPYFVNYNDTTVTAESSKILVTIGGTLRYTIIKNTGTSVRLDISELIRDYINPTFSGLLNTGTVGAVAVSLAVSFWDALNATGTQVYTTSDTLTAYDGYRYFSEGNNFTIPTGNLLSGTSIYAPQNTAGSFYVMGAGGTLSIQVYDSAVTGAVGSTGITIKRQLCGKYTPIKCVFLNKFGVHQEFYFFTKKTDSLTVSGEQYKANIIVGDGTFDSKKHQVKDFSKNGTIRYTLNTGYVGEDVNSYMQELMLSEYVWLVISGSVVPVRVVSSDVQYKTSLNDKLVNYTVDFEQSNDIISSVR